MNEELKVIITATVDGLKKGVKEAQSSLEGLKGIGKKVGDSISSAIKTTAKVVTAASAAAAAGIVAITKQAVDNYAEYEQLVGGVETLFKDSAGKVQQYASEAYKTAGMSANDYMETVTSFSASLLQSLGGDTAEAAEYAQQAIVDMSDNANKMGTDMTAIQNAYQGFAKQNYTMLDNLKLGYGGTKEEMQRLIDDANRVKVANGEMADLTIDSFADVTEAIHIIQTEMGITGTTAKEASTTIEGSVNSMKAAWSNLLTGIADENADFAFLVNNFVESVGTVMDNLLPRIGIALEGAAKLVEQLVPTVLNRIPELIQSFLPTLITSAVNIGKSLVEGLNKSLPVVLEVFQELMPKVVKAISDMIPKLLELGINIVKSLLDGITKTIPEVIKNVKEILPQIIDVLTTGIPDVLNTAVELFMAIVDGIQEVLPDLIEALPKIIEAILKALSEALPKVLDTAMKLFMTIVDSIPKVLPKLIDALPKIIDTILKALVNALPKVLDGAVKMFTAIVEAIPKVLPNLVAALPKIITSVVSAIVQAVPQVLKAGMQMFGALVTSATNIIPNLVKACGDIINNIKTWLVDKAKSIMDFDWHFPKLKLPHFSIKGSFSLTPPSVPHLSVDWYAKGGVFDSPTMFGYGDRVGGLGEDGAEAVVPLEKNTQWLDRLASMLNEKMGGSGRPIVLQVDGKTFAQISVDTINDLTRQTGSLPLKLA